MIPKKNIKEQGKQSSADKSIHNEEEENENLGLDADHSSDTPYQHLNNDNDLISGNPDGETDDNDDSGPLGYSPLEEK
jgi:hypothetical protein